MCEAGEDGCQEEACICEAREGVCQEGADAFHEAREGACQGREDGCQEGADMGQARDITYQARDHWTLLDVLSSIWEENDKCRIHCCIT